METAVQFLNYSCRLQRMMMTWILILVWRNGALAGSLETVSFGWDMWNVRHLNMPLTWGRSCVINHHHFFLHGFFLSHVHVFHSFLTFSPTFCYAVFYTVGFLKTWHLAVMYVSSRCPWVFRAFSVDFSGSSQSSSRGSKIIFNFLNQTLAFDVASQGAFKTNSCCFSFHMHIHIHIPSN